MSLSVGAELLGQRMVIRYAMGDGAPGDGPGDGPSMTDVIGRVLAVDDARVVLERRDGTTASVRQDLIALAKVVPAVPKRSRSAQRISADNLDRICTRGWPPVESQLLGEWELRAAGGFTRRANSAAVHGDPGGVRAEALAAITDFYRARNLVARAQVVVGGPWESVFEAAGWAPRSDLLGATGVQVAQMSQALAGPPGDDSIAVVIAPAASSSWLAHYRRPGDPPGDEVARAVVEGPHTVGFASIEDLAIGRVVVTGEWAGISCLDVAPAARRGGLGRAVIEACLRWAFERGADKAYIQVSPDNTAALALYGSYGFVDHHAYRYVSPPA